MGSSHERMKLKDMEQQCNRQQPTTECALYYKEGMDYQSMLIQNPFTAIYEKWQQHVLPRVSTPRFSLRVQRI